MRLCGQCCKKLCANHFSTSRKEANEQLRGGGQPGGEARRWGNDLASGEPIETVPPAQWVRFIDTRTSAVWKAVERACTTGDFRPNQSRLCDWCSFKRWCPAFGGSPELAAVEAPADYAALLGSAVS